MNKEGEGYVVEEGEGDLDGVRKEGEGSSQNLSPSNSFTQGKEHFLIL